jgi:fluoride exporter
MDEEPQERDDPVRASPDGSALDEPGIPFLGLSVATLLAIFVGGAVGTVARYLLEVHHPAAQSGIPWTTLAINLSGSLVIGLLVPLTDHVAHRAPLVRPLLVIGFLGGWTTYSTLAVEATLLAKDGDVGNCLAYLAATVVGGLALVVLGHALGRRLVPA